MIRKYALFIALICILLHILPGVSVSQYNKSKSDLHILAQPAPQDLHWVGGFATPVEDNPTCPAIAVVENYLLAVINSRLYLFDETTGIWNVIGLVGTGYINALAIDKNKIFIAGDFQGINGVTSVKRIGCWQDTAWVNYGTNISSCNIVQVSVSTTGKLYICGDFFLDSSSEKTYIAVWDSTKWVSLGTGTDGIVKSMAFYGGKVYAAGYFTSAGGVEAAYVACWDEITQQWSALGAGLSNRAFAVAADDAGKIFVGGYFDSAGVAPANNIARWDGSQWQPLGSGIDGFVNTISTHSGKVYVGGQFGFTGDGKSVNNIAVWDGSGWKGFDMGVGGGSIPVVLTSVVNAVGNLYIGGTFNLVGKFYTNGISRWDGTKWIDMFPDGLKGANSSVGTFDIGSDSNLYVGGSYTRAGLVSTWGIAAWNGSDWLQLKKGLKPTAPVNGIAAFGDDLYVTGWILGAFDSVVINNVCRWNIKEEQWHPLGNGIIGGESSVGPIAVAPNGDVYIGGRFTEADTVQSSRIVKFSGTGYEPLVSAGGTFAGVKHSVSQNYSVEAIAIDEAGLVYVGGMFNQAGDNTISSIAIWSDNIKSWLPVGSHYGIRGTVYVIYQHGDDFYIGGSFDSAGNIRARNIVKYSRMTDTWTALGKGTNNPVYALFIYGNTLFIGGSFSRAGDTTAYAVARYNLKTGVYEPLGSGLRTVIGLARVEALMIFKNRLYVGGSFLSAGGRLATNFACWDDLSTVIDEQPVAASIGNCINIYPNPASDMIRIDYGKLPYEPVEIAIIDCMGISRIVKQIDRCGLGVCSLTLNIADLAPGVYYCKVKAGCRIVFNNFIKM